jgi:hypothetical protein
MSSTPSKELEEFGISVERFMHFMNLWTIYSDLLKKKYTPSVNADLDKGGWSEHSVETTMMFILYAFFYSLIEDDQDGVNAFRIWRTRYPEEEQVIRAAEAEVLPFRNDLRVFRNRLGFHGSRTRSHETPGFDVFSKHSGTAIFDAMKDFKSLGAALLGKDNAHQGISGYDSAQIRKWIDSIEQHATSRKP